MRLNKMLYNFGFGFEFYLKFGFMVSNLDRIRF